MSSSLPTLSAPKLALAHESGEWPVVDACGRQRIGGYIIDELLGSGGMGDVYAARDAQGADVAMKVLHPELWRSNEARARFGREATLMQSLRGPHWVAVHEVSLREPPFIVMERLRGMDLADKLAAAGRLSIDEAVHWLTEACEAMAEAHALGVVHRDLKPANLFLAATPTGYVLKVIDLGISRALEDKTRITRTQSTVGTPIYMSPEQAKNSRTADARADVWSLGVILYELVTGDVPFDGDSLTEVAIKVCTLQPVPPSERCAGIPPRLEQIILRALEKEPANRQPDVLELARELKEFRRSTVAPVVMPAPAKTVPPPRRKPVPALVMGGLAAVAVAIAASLVAVFGLHDRSAAAAGASLPASTAVVQSPVAEAVVDARASEPTERIAPSMALADLDQGATATPPATQTPIAQTAPFRQPTTGRAAPTDQSPLSPMPSARPNARVADASAKPVATPRWSRPRFDERQ